MATKSSGHVVEFYYDISCPFAYIASTRIQALAARTSSFIYYRPVLLGAIYRATSAPQGAAGSASDVFNSTKKTVSGIAFRRTLGRLGVEYNEPPRHPVKTTRALRLLYYVGQEGGKREKLTEGLFRAYWVQGLDVSDTAVLKKIVKESGIDGWEGIVEAIDSGTFEGQEQRRELEASTDLAVQRGTPGVPGFWIPDEIWVDKKGEKRKGRLYWGQDRMQFFEAVLMALNSGGNGDSIGAIARPLQNLIPRSTATGKIPGGEKVKLEFWYDFSSPWAFLGWTQLARLQRQFGENLQIEMKPFLLGILFREIGAPNTPMTAVSAQKRNYMALDHLDWCRWWNAVNAQSGRQDNDIEFYWADKFPIRTPTVLRAVLVEPRLCGLLFKACWQHNLDMSDDQVLERVIAEAGHDAQDIMKKANEPKYKNELRARTKEAKDMGLCGVPSYRVFRKKKGDDEWRQSGDLVWGQDELAVVEDLIAGWTGRGVVKVEDDNGQEVVAKL